VTIERAPREAEAGNEKARVLFVNAGILGMQSFSKYIREAAASDPGIEARHINLTEDMTASERLLRRAMCARFWPDGFLGLRNVDFARLRQEYHAGLQAARRIRRIVRNERIDVLHFHRQSTAYASLGLMRRVPSIVSIDCTQDAVIDVADSSLERWTYGANAAIDGRILRAAAAIVATSNWTANLVRRRYNDCRTPIHVMPTPVRLRYFDEGWIDERAEGARSGVMPRVLFVGGDFARKGGEDLLAAWTAGELHQHAALDIVTDWSVDVAAIPNARVLRRIESYSPDWCELWRRADIFVMPSRSEAFANVFQEAAAAGLPSVATSVNAIPEVVEHGTCGLIVPPRDPRALAAALELLIRSPELRRQYGREARARALGRANPDDYRKNLFRLIRSVARPPASERTH
jgi:glycosyltransferase involved in cell wall biosynthesis